MYLIENKMREKSLKIALIQHNIIELYSDKNAHFIVMKLINSNNEKTHQILINIIIMQPAMRGISRWDDI